MKQHALRIVCYLSLAFNTGCFFYRPRVDQDITTGEKLRAIALTNDPQFSEWLAARRSMSPDHVRECALLTRMRLLSNPPNMRAVVRDIARTTPTNYSTFLPGLYSPVDVELADLHLARTAGAINDTEMQVLTAALAEQARIPLLRRASETAPVAIAGTVHYNAFSGPATLYNNSSDQASREAFLGTWISVWVGAWTEAAWFGPIDPVTQPLMTRPFWTSDPNTTPEVYTDLRRAFWIHPTIEPSQRAMQPESINPD